MGIKNYSKQVSLLNHSKQDVQLLKEYVISIRRLIENINGSWLGREDKYLILTIMKDCVKEATEIINDYNNFIVNAETWLEEMNKLDKITKSLKLTSIVGNTMLDISHNYSNRISINTKEMRGYATKIKSCGNRIEEILPRMKQTFNGIDSFITNRFPTKYSIGAINMRVLKLKNKNSRVANNLRQICAIYEQADRKLLDIIDDVSVIGESCGKVNSSMPSEKGKKDKNRVYINQKQAVVVEIIKQAKKSKTIKQILDDLKEVTGGGGIADDIKDVVDKLKSGEYIDVIEKIGSKLIGKLGDNDTVMKFKALTIVSKLAVEKDSYLMENYDKYLNEAEGAKTLLKGHFTKFGVKTMGGLIQVLGKGTVDAGCRLIDSYIHSTPLGKALDYTNAMCEDSLGTSPGRIFNKFANSISNGVDFIVDKTVEISEKVDIARQQGENELKKACVRVQQVAAKNIKSVLVDKASDVFVGSGAGGGGATKW